MCEFNQPLFEVGIKADNKLCKIVCLAHLYLLSVNQAPILSIYQTECAIVESNYGD